MEGAASSTPRQPPERRSCPDQTRRGQEQTEKRTKERSGTRPNAIQLSLRHCQVSREAAGTCRHPTARRRSQSHLRLAKEKAGMGRARRQGRQRMGELSADETSPLSPAPGINNVALPWQPPPTHVWHSARGTAALCLSPPGQEDRQQDLVTSTPDHWHHLPPHFHPTPSRGTCCSEPRSASWPSSPASSQWCRVGFPPLPAAAPSISAPLVERELSEVCTAVLSLHQTHCSPQSFLSPRACNLPMAAPSAPLPTLHWTLLWFGQGAVLHPHPQTSRRGGDSDPTRSPSATCGRAHPEQLSPHHHMSHV